MRKHAARLLVIAVIGALLSVVTWPAAAASRSQGDPSSIGVPLKAPTPSWFTEEVKARVDSSPEGVAAAPTDAPFPGEVGIRPGSWMIAPYWCTMNFVFAKGAELAIGTAGHCVDKIGEVVTLLTVAPGGTNPVLVNIGTVVARKDAGIGSDFALVLVYPHLRSWVSPTIAGIGGPCGIYTGATTQGVFHYGHGVGVGTGGTPRAGVSTAWKADSFEWAGVLYGGDSGSAVRVTDLKAAGNLTHGLAIARVVPLPLFIDQRGRPIGGGYGTRMSKILQIAKGYTLVNSPLC